MRVLWFGKNFMQARLPAVPWNGYGRGCARSYLNHVGQSRCTYLHQILEQPQLYTFIIIRSEGKYIVKHYGTHSVVVTHLRHGSAVRAETHYYEIGWRPFSYHWTDPGESWSRLQSNQMCQLCNILHKGSWSQVSQSHKITRHCKDFFRHSILSWQHHLFLLCSSKEKRKYTALWHVDCSIPN